MATDRTGSKVRRQYKQSMGSLEWAVLTDDYAIARRRKAAEEQYGGMTTEQRDYLRRRLKTDLFFLTYSLGYKELNEGLHGHYIRWLQANWGERYRMTLFPRDHFKSTVNTVCDSVQIVLPNDAQVQVFPYILGPNAKILLSHENRESASRFLYEITKHFCENPLLLALFPECIPSKRVQRVNKWELDLPRTEHHKEPTFDTIGSGGAAQGRHFNWLKLDDLVGEEARDSEIVMKRLLMWFDGIKALLTSWETDGFDLTGTRWANLDVYNRAIEKFGVKKDRSILRSYFQDDIDKMSDGSLVVYARGAIEDEKPIFPERFPLEELNQERKNLLIWSTWWANNPRAGGLTELSSAWLKFYNVMPRDRLAVMAGDSSWTVNTRDLDRLVLIDPAMGFNEKSDECGFVVTGTDKKMNIYILEAWKERLRPPEVMDKMFQLYTRWNPRAISIESVVFSSIFADWFRERCQKLGVHPYIHLHKRPGGRNAKSKHDYIRALSNYAAGGQIYALEGMHQLRDEWEWFPMGNSEHILDALSQGPELWSPGRDSETSDDYQKAVDMVMDERDALTGY